MLGLVYMSRKMQEQADGYDENGGLGASDPAAGSGSWWPRSLVEGLFRGILSGETQREKARKAKIDNIAQTALESMRLGEWKLLFESISMQLPTPGEFRIVPRLQGGISFQYYLEDLRGITDTVCLQGYVDLGRKVHISSQKKFFTAEARLFQKLLTSYIKILRKKYQSVEVAYKAGELSYQPTVLNNIQLANQIQSQEDVGGLPCIGRLVKNSADEWIAVPTSPETDLEMLDSVKKHSIAVGMARSFVAIFESLLPEFGIPHVSSVLYSLKKDSIFVLDGVAYAMPFISRMRFVGSVCVQIHISVGDSENGVEQLDFYIKPEARTVGYKVVETDNIKLLKLLNQLERTSMIVSFLPKK